ncbi:hypothetical protein [Secundilactobacillus silagei]|uniref:Uncharacterized protein n=1 Tax=Secundilactobacillus silagei JCM 19001 TaxID=1302250 RepID=A0A1Z5IGU5_9LACO|nr:hypothetical protein [Secundilactobacillus silagei]TDG73391.1 hypothetical protein C5L25_000540 [Secundilactobacillus silagei JCM 19001]GAX00762.1 hypothetical protein IWT126_00777 [Secundilactobacillus silagei JCM 19001]
MKKIITRIVITLLVSTSTSLATSVVVPKTTDAAAIVWIAPRHGKKYHYNKHCWGLTRAHHHIKQISLTKAKATGYTLCRIEKR